MDTTEDFAPRDPWFDSQFVPVFFLFFSRSQMTWWMQLWVFKTCRSACFAKDPSKGILPLPKRVFIITNHATAERLRLWTSYAEVRGSSPILCQLFSLFFLSHCLRQLWVFKTCPRVKSKKHSVHFFLPNAFCFALESAFVAWCPHIVTESAWASRQPG